MHTCLICLSTTLVPAKTKENWQETSENQVHVDSIILVWKRKFLVRKRWFFSTEKGISCPRHLTRAWIISSEGSDKSWLHHHFNYYFHTSTHPTISTTADIKHLQTKSWSRATIDHFLHSVGYNISNPFLYITITSISFLDLPTSIFGTFVALNSPARSTASSQDILDKYQPCLLADQAGTCINPQITMYLAFIILLINWCYTAEDWIWIGRDAIPKLSANHHLHKRCWICNPTCTEQFRFTQQLLWNVFQASEPGKWSRIAVGTLNGVRSEIK